MEINKREISFHEVALLLRKALGDPWRLHQTSPLTYCDSALEILIATVLTQATSDKNALNAWFNFKKVFPAPEMVLTSAAGVLEQTINTSGLAAQKARVIRGVLEKVREELGEYSLESLKADPAMAWSFLNSLPGIGPKTAACTMLFGLAFPYFPADVHIHRIVRRLGLIAGKKTPTEIQEFLARQIPEGMHQELHILLLNLGRRYCRPREPACPQCPLLRMCLEGSKFT